MSATPSPVPREILIEPSRGLRALAWGELWAYRDLLWLLVWRDFVARYKQTVLGPLWHVLQPVITSGVFTLVFTHIIEVDVGDVPPTLFYLCGMLAWNYFAQNFNSTSGTFVNNAGLFGKVYFPRLIVPLAGVVSNLISFAIQFAVFLVVLGVYRASHPGVGWGLRIEALALPLVVLQLAALSLGVGLWLTALTAKFRDFTVLSGFLIQLWLYVTPIIYPLSKVPAQWRYLAAANPVAVPVETFRAMLLGTGAVSTPLLLVSIGVTLFALVTGVLLFQRVEKTFIDTV